jgi:hypothetical protein
MPLVGKTFCVPDANSNLLSVRQLVKDGGRFEGNEDEMKIYNSKGKLILIGKDHGDGFWSCHQSDLVKAYLKIDSHYTAV